MLNEPSDRSLLPFTKISMIPDCDLSRGIKPVTHLKVSCESLLHK